MKKHLLITLDVPDEFDYTDKELTDNIAMQIHSIISDTKCKILDKMVSSDGNTQFMIDSYNDDIKIIEMIKDYTLLDIDHLAQRIVECTFDRYKEQTTIRHVITEINEFIN